VDHEFLAPLAGDGRFELLRGRRRHTGAPVLVKRARQATAADVAALQREAAVAASLGSAATLLPRLIEGASAAVLVMEDPGGELLSTRLAGGRLPVEAALAIGLHIARALGELHGRRLVHRALCPEGVLCRVDDLQAWLIDFAEVCDGAAAAARRVTTSVPAARLVYLAPEQTGRMDHLPDARSDLYALGIVLYEMLTGAPPFRSDDALELIHWHLAGAPVEPCQLDERIPAPLSAVVMKLLAKLPQERYQSAGGLAQDLAVCARDWAALGDIRPFPLGRRDIGERLTVSTKLYGREREVHLLLQAFERVCNGQGGRAMLLVEGFSGVGKTALIQQLYRPIVRRQGYFISGKFDQVARGVPFGALIQAFRALVRQLLTESEEQLARWRDTLALALGTNGGVLAEVIPEITFIVGPQPAPAVLGSIEAQNRFQRVLESFLAAIAQPAHPLVLFLDDLQWADAATLALLEPLATSPEIHGLMLMGAYRDHELDASPRLARTLAALDRAGVALTRVTLGPLSMEDLVALVADTLHASASQAEPLARVVQAKTGGNPFFVIQFLRTLEREGHLRFDDEHNRWTFAIERITQLPLADNVVDLMTHAIQRLPAKAQYALTLAACIGNRFEAATLAIVSEQSLAATAQDLDQARAEGLIVPLPGSDEEGEAFQFLHDRVQQSAYALIPADRRRMVHLAVGRLLRSRATPAQIEAAPFRIVEHLNLGRDLIVDTGERREVAALDLAAGRRAKSATAHDSALELFRAGIELLGARAFETDADLAFELHLEAAESLSLCGQFDDARAALTALLAHAATPIARARVLRLRSLQCESTGLYAQALASAREGLQDLGVTLPDAEGDKLAALEREIGAVEALRDGRAIAALLDLPTMTEPTVRMVMSMLTDTWSAAYILGDATLARLISATMVRLSLQHGNVEESAYGYVTHAITIGPVRGDYAAAYEYGRLALAVNARFDDTRRRAKVYQQFHAHVNLWCRPLLTCIPYAREACRAGLDGGDFLYAAYAAGTETWSAIASTQDLTRFVRDYTPSVALIDKLKNPAFADSVRLILNWAKALQGRTGAPLSLSDAGFDEAAFVRRYRDNAFFAGMHAVARLQLAVLLGTPAQALEAARHSKSLIGALPGTVWPVLHDFWHGLALAGAMDLAPSAERDAWLDEIRRAQALFAERAANCAENFRCQALLLAAEIARLEGRMRDAVEHCEQAIEFAASGPMIAWHALAHELHGRLRLATGKPSMAFATLSRARDRYAEWGATAKAAAMVRQYPVLAERRDDTERPAPAAFDAASLADVQALRADPADALDLFSLLKATQAIAGETGFSGLLAQLLHIAIENAGAERGALVLDGEAGPQVHAAEANGPRVGMERGVPLAQSDRVPAGIVQFVRRTGEAVVLADAFADEQHGGDPYVQRHRLRALACLPVRQQGRALGVLVLEHRGVGAVFTPQRIDTLRILATQAAISVENARLVTGLQREIDERRQAQQQLGDALAEVQRLKDNLEAENSYLRRDLIANVSHDLRTPLVSMRGYLEVLATRGHSLEPAQRSQYLGIAVRQCEHLAALIDELFELAKLDFKGVVLACEPFAFAELAADVVQKFQLRAEQAGIRLGVEAAPGLPFVEADISLMERVLENLIGNALQHTPHGGCIAVGVAAADGALQVRVSDTGRGIPADELPFVFDRFYRGQGAGRAGGAGLGLAICRRIVELHGGAIRAESDGRTGSCFRVDLPLNAADAR
jgi:predicted ATPase/signal transduction histidine kinase